MMWARARLLLLVCAGVAVVVALAVVFSLMSRTLLPPAQGSDPPFPDIEIPRPVGLDAPIPANAVFVSNRGEPVADGSAAHPFVSIADAIEAASAGTTIVVAGGEYHESLHVPAELPDLTIRAAPGETVWLDGSSTPGTPAVAEAGSRWRFTGAAPDLDRSPTYRRGAPDGRTEGWRWVSPERPLAADPAQVWLAGRPLRQVSPAAAVEPGTFAINGGDVIVGDDPTGRDVRIGRLSHAVVVNAARTHVEGIGMRRYVPSVPDFGAVVLDGVDTTMSHVVVADSSTTGVSVQSERVTLREVAVVRAGMLGVHAHQAHDLLIEGGLYTHNNSRGFNMAPTAGGIKITASANVTARGATIADNLGTGLWLDEAVTRAHVLRVRASGNSLHGLLVELSADVDIAACVFEDNDGSGIRVQNSSGIRVWNVTSRGNARAVDFVQDGRVAGSAGAPEVPDDPRIPPMPWVIGDSEVVNTVLGPSTGDADLAVQDFRGRLDANDVGIELRSNLYVRAADGSPRWTHVWSRPNDDPRVYTSLEAFHEEVGQDRDSALSTEDDGAARPQGALVPADLGSDAGLPRRPRIGAPS